MKYYIFLVLTLLHLAQCITPNLIVKKLDKTLIAKKRQDTMDMCRIFTEETRRTQHSHAPKIIKSYIPKNSNIRQKRDVNNNSEENHRHKRATNEERPKENHRYKRGATMKYAVNPALNPADARRVENIVDKLYDDMEEKGQRVTYRQVRTTGSVKLNGNKKFKPSRRFDFAPGELTGPQEQLKKMIDYDDGPFESKARWKHGIVPYYIDFKTYDAHLSDVIMKAFDYVEKATCIRMQRLRERPTDKQSLEAVPWVYISNPTGIRQCVHSNEKRRVNGVLMTVFGYDCMGLGDIVHEVMHILGYSHEHLRSDRDQHVSILWENIKPGYKKYFDLNIFGSEYELEHLPYDYSSILHYPSRAFSKNGQVTIMTEQGVKIGQREGLSEIDVEKVAVIYSYECVARNREYLLQTCPSVVKSVTKPINVTQSEIEDYFKNRLWPFGIIHYRLRDKIEFTVEERENIRAVFRHIEEETCLQFKDVGTYDDDDDEESLEVQRAILAEKEASAKALAVTEAFTELPEETDQPHELGSEAETERTETDPGQAESEAGQAESETGQAESEPEQAESETGQAESETGQHESETGQPESEVAKTETETNAPKTDGDDTETPVISVGPIVLAQDSNNENSYEITNGSKVAEIIITNPKNSVRQGSIPNIGTKKNLIDNEIHKNDIESVLNNEMLGPKETDFKWMNLTMKRALLKRAIVKKQKKEHSRRSRRDVGIKPPRRHANAVLVLKRTADSSCPCPEPGTPKGDQVLDIAAGCFNSVNDLLHFFVHVLGLDHQHNMHDRDNFLHVVWDNLTADVRLEMANKLPPAASAGFSYDYQSVMHYPWLQIKSGKTNIMYPIWNDGWAMGHWQGLSSVDVQKLNLLYFNQCMERQKHEAQEF